MNVLLTVADAGGVSRTRRLPAAEVRRLVASGDLTRPRRGLVALPGADTAVLLAATLGGVVSCASAASRQGLRLLHSPREVHVTVPRKGVRKAPGVVLYRRDVQLDGWLTSRSRTVADCLRCLPPEEGLVVADSALEAGIGRPDIETHLRGRACGAARAALGWADGRSQAVGETVLRRRLQIAGVGVDIQVWIEGVGWVDLLVAGRIVVEVDGYAYHSSQQHLARDRRRDAYLAELGYVVLRFTSNDVVRAPDHVVRVILAVLANR